MSKQTMYDNKNIAIPKPLKKTQEWFAGIITNRLDDNTYIQPISPAGYLIAEEASRYVVPSPTLNPHQRMQIYNQQYWWRLLKAMHENFPLVTRLFGYHAFNETIGIPYLLKYPPTHWSLNVLGERLPQWIKKEYKAPDKKLIQNAVDLDWAFTASFTNPQKASLDLNLASQNLEQLLSYTFYLQSHLFLFKWDYDLFKFREEFLKQDVDYWIDNDFPTLPKEKTYHFVLYRTVKNHIGWKEISLAEFILLERLQKGSNIENACEALEKQDTSVYEYAAQHLQSWIQEWVQRGWLTLEKHAS